MLAFYHWSIYSVPGLGNRALLCRTKVPLIPDLCSTGITAVYTWFSFPGLLYPPLSLWLVQFTVKAALPSINPLWKHPEVFVTNVLGLAQSIRLTLNINYTLKQQTKALTELSVGEPRKVLTMHISQNSNVQIIKSARNQYKAKIQ